MSKDKLNIVEWMSTRMVECKLDRSGALVFQPYIMALIRHKTGFLGIEAWCIGISARSRTRRRLWNERIRLRLWFHHHLL
jgi:hypothetical protein